MVASVSLNAPRVLTSAFDPREDDTAHKAILGQKEEGNHRDIARDLTEAIGQDHYVPGVLAKGAGPG